MNIHVYFSTQVFLLSKLLLLSSFLALISISQKEREKEKDYHYILLHLLPHIPLFSISSMYTLLLPFPSFSSLSEGEKK